MADDGKQAGMSAAEQTRDYDRVNGRYDRARAEEVRRYGPGGYKGDPGIDAAERQAEIMGDATIQPLPRITQSQRDAARAQAAANSNSSTAEAGRQQQVERPARSSLR